MGSINLLDYFLLQSIILQQDGKSWKDIIKWVSYAPQDDDESTTYQHLSIT